MSHSNRARWVVLGAAAAFVFLGLFGCYPDTVMPVKIGYTVSLTGKYAQTGQYQQEAYALWAEEVNERGGLLGRPVWLIHYDDQSDPKKAATIYERLITEEKVDLVLGPYSSPVTDKVADVTENHRYPMIASGAASSTIFAKGRRYVFGIYSPARDYMDGALELAKAKGFKTVALLYADSVFPKSCAKGVKDKAPSYGLKVVFEAKYPRDSNDLTKQLTSIKRLAPDVVLSAGYLSDSLLITRQMKDLEVTPKIISFTVGAAQPEFGAGLGELAEFVFGASQWEPDPRLPYPGQKEWVERYKKRWGREPDYHAASGWGAQEVLEACVRRLETLERERLRLCLSSTEMMTVHGLYKVDSETGEQRGHEILLIQWQDGKKEIVYPPKFASAPPMFPAPSLAHW